jgi:hypothetical protein
LITIVVETYHARRAMPSLDASVSGLVAGER